ncbi:hypothetical protein [Xenorhabdus sp. TH1]|uniref:hypothetical protein n=1 Tax=Xenorhabdus sp. TH1 TaxID=3130166 RepID=UPI0030CC9697
MSFQLIIKVEHRVTYMRSHITQFIVNHAQTAYPNEYCGLVVQYPTSKMVGI